MLQRKFQRTKYLKKNNRGAYLAAFLIPLLICVIICIGNEVYPFGSQCILHVDMYHQYCPFFVEFLNKLRSGGSLMYSWNLGLGSDFVSLYAYYLASPLNWLIVLWPSGYVIEFMTVLILVKIALSGLAFFYFLRVHFGLVGKDGRFHSCTMLPALVFSTAYALSGFVAAYSWDIMWLDCIALFPAIMAGLELLVRERKVILYYVSLSVCIFANYYISIMICIFLVFYFVLLFLREGRPVSGDKRKHWRFSALGRFTLCSALAGGTSAVLLLPEIAVLSVSGSAGEGFPVKAEWYFGILAELGRGATAASVYTSNDHWPNLYAGAFALLLVWLYLLNRRISWKEKIPRFLMLGFFLISFAHNQLDYIWHGMHFPQSLPGRQSFLYIFMLLSMGYATVRKWKGTRLWHIIVSVVGAIALLMAASTVGDESVTEPYAYIVTALLIAAYGILMLVVKLVGTRPGRIVARFAMAAAVIELGVNMALTGFSVTSRTSYTEKQKDYRALIKLAEEREGENAFFRVEDTGRKTKNDDALYGYASGTIFSSLMNLDVSHLYQGLYMEGGKNFYSHNGATPLTSGMFSVKYYLSNSSMDEDIYRTLVGQSGTSYLYENKYWLPLGYVIDQETIEGWEPERTYRLRSINAFAAAVGGGKNLLDRVYCDSQEEPGSTTVTIAQDGYYYATYDSCSSDTLTVKRSDGWSRRYSKTTHRYLIELGTCHAGDMVEITNRKEEEIFFSVYRMNEETLRQAYENLSRQTFTPDEVSDRTIRGHIDVKEAGRLILSVPADMGWSLRVDGEPAEISAWQNALIGVDLAPGGHEIELHYTTPYFREGLAISIACVLLFVVYAVGRRRKREGETLQ